MPCCGMPVLQNWGKEVVKWLGDRLDTVVVDDTKADKVKKFLQVTVPLLKSFAAVDSEHG